MTMLATAVGVVAVAVVIAVPASTNFPEEAMVFHPAVWEQKGDRVDPNDLSSLVDVRNPRAGASASEA